VNRFAFLVSCLSLSGGEWALRSVGDGDARVGGRSMSGMWCGG
jgi:hypothetical protein